jgi:hypothetical protein
MRFGAVYYPEHWSDARLMHQAGFNTVPYEPALERGAWWAFAIPGVAIALVVVACSLINYGIDEISNPRLVRTRSVAGWRRTRAATT